MQKKIIYALDFDGVLCDSATELAHSGWKCAQTRWSDMADVDVSATLIERYRHVRPLIETGYESILIMRLLYQGVSVDDFHQHYEHLIQTLINDEKLAIPELKQSFGELRDTWIRDDLNDWLSKCPLFEGIAEKLETLQGKTWYIITTKQTRFVTHILKDYGIQLADDAIFGLERQMSKQHVLQQLTEQHPDYQFIFVEDRLPTLIGVQENPALKGTQLQLVDWGYNTASDRLLAQERDIPIIDFAHFL